MKVYRMGTQPEYTRIPVTDAGYWAKVCYYFQCERGRHGINAVWDNLIGAQHLSGDNPADLAALNAISNILRSFRDQEYNLRAELVAEPAHPKECNCLRCVNGDDDYIWHKYNG